MVFCFVVGTNLESAFEVEGHLGMSISNLREIIYEKKKNNFKIKGFDANNLCLWEVDIPGDTENVKLKTLQSSSRDKDKEEIIIQELRGKKLSPFSSDFGDIFKCDSKNIRIIAQPLATTACHLRVIAQVFENIEEVLRKAESHWTKFKDKLVKKIELEEFRVSDHIYKDSISASGIPMINARPSFILHSLPDSDNKEGYIAENVLNDIINKAMKQHWLFLMGTSGSGITRSLYELFCRKYGIYFSLNTENGYNLGSRDMDLTIADLGFKLVPNKHQENNYIALRYTRAMLLGRLFILTKLLEFHRSSNSIDFTPKQWLLMQLLPLQIYELEDFWYCIACEFRNLDQNYHNELVTTFIMTFKSFVPGQTRLPIATDESQMAIRKYKDMFFSTDPNNQETRPFFAILLWTVLQLSTT